MWDYVGSVVLEQTLAVYCVLRDWTGLKYSLLLDRGKQRTAGPSCVVSARPGQQKFVKIAQPSLNTRFGVPYFSITSQNHQPHHHQSISQSQDKSFQVKQGKHFRF